MKKTPNRPDAPKAIWGVQVHLSGSVVAVGGEHLGDLSNRFVRRPIDVLIGNLMAQSLRISDKALGSIGRDSLAALVMTDISLSATQANCEGFLGYTKALADQFNSAHAPNNSATISQSQYRRYFDL